MKSAIAEKELGWRPVRPLAQGLKETWETMCAMHDTRVADVRAMSRRARLARLQQRFIPYAENLAGAALTAGVGALQVGTTVNAMTALDFAFLYI